MDAPEEFLQRFLPAEPDLRAFIGSLVRDRQARDDVFQEVVLTLWREFERFDPTRSFGAWARGIAANKILQQRHRDARFPLAFPPETVAAIVEAFDRTEAEAAPRRAALEACIKELPEKSRQLLVMRYEVGREIGQIAQDTGRSLDAVYQALSRVRALLEACIRRRLAEGAEVR